MSKAMNLRIAKARVAKKQRDRELRIKLVRLDMEIAKAQMMMDVYCSPRPRLHLVSV
jgi:hypothetical protein